MKCGFDDVRALQIDHIYSDGADERRLFSGQSYYKHILDNLSSGRFQVLCANCNFCKRYEKFEHGKRFDLDALSMCDLTALDPFDED